MPLFIGGFGPTEMMIILALAILLFGANKLPKLARSSGQAMGEFQKGREEVEKELREMSKPIETESDDDVETETETATAA
jgi:sec-independent protein translocase protein TatA